MSQPSPGPASGMPDLDRLTPGYRYASAPRRLTRTDFVRYAGISGDFNPMHHDEVRAQAAGEPSVFGHGMFSAGLLASTLTDLVGLRSLRSYQVRFTRTVRPDELVTGEITVRDTHAGDGGTVVELDCVLRSDAGDVLRGTARASANPNAASAPDRAEAAASRTTVPGVWPGMTVRPQRVLVEQGPVSVFADLMGAGDAVHRSPAAAAAAGYAGPPVPPTYSFVMWHWGAHADLQTGDEGDVADLVELSAILGRDGGMMLHGEQGFVYHRPLVVGETVERKAVVADVSAKVRRDGAPMRLATLVTQVLGADGLPAVTETATFICLGRSAS